jgi:hypothetical protein
MSRCMNMGWAVAIQVYIVRLLVRERSNSHMDGDTEELTSKTV